MVFIIIAKFMLLFGGNSIGSISCFIWCIQLKYNAFCDFIVLLIYYPIAKWCFFLCDVVILLMTNKLCFLLWD
jgi:hypothetical protein